MPCIPTVPGKVLTCTSHAVAAPGLAPGATPAPAVAAAMCGAAPATQAVFLAVHISLRLKAHALDCAACGAGAAPLCTRATALAAAVLKPLPAAFLGAVRASMLPLDTPPRRLPKVYSQCL